MPYTLQSPQQAKTRRKKHEQKRKKERKKTTCKTKTHPNKEQISFPDLIYLFDLCLCVLDTTALAPGDLTAEPGLEMGALWGLAFDLDTGALWGRLGLALVWLLGFWELRGALFAGTPQMVPARSCSCQTRPTQKDEGLSAFGVFSSDVL